MESEDSLPHSQVLSHDPILSNIDPVHVLKFQFPKIHLYIILQSTPGSPKWSLYFSRSHQNPVYTSALPRTCYMPRPPHSPRIITRIIFGEYRSLSSSLCSFLHSPVTSSILGPNILLNTLLRFLQPAFLPRCE